MTDTPNHPPARDAVVVNIYTIGQSSPQFSWEDRFAISEDEITAALGARVPGGASVYAWLPMVDGTTIHETARDVMRSALAAAARQRQLGEERGRVRSALAAMTAADEAMGLPDDGLDEAVAAVAAVRASATLSAHSPDAGKMVAAGEVERIVAAIEADLERQASVQNGCEYMLADECGVASAQMNIVVAELASAILAALPSTPPAADAGLVAKLESYRLKDGYVPAYIAGNNRLIDTLLAALATSGKDEG